MGGRGLVIALLISVALNLFLISAGVSIYLFGMPGVTRTQNAGLGRATKMLPEADRKPFVTMLRADGVKVRPDNRRARALREQAWTALATGSETGDVIKQQLAQARSLNQASRTFVEDAVVDYGLALDPAGRQALGQALRPSALSKKVR